ncbi:MAG: SDR family NAD(P)-dependent oxidoreductase [Steroidobacteraceae bacterium]
MTHPISTPDRGSLETPAPAERRASRGSAPPRERAMSAGQPIAAESPLSSRGRARRSFLERYALAAAGTAVLAPAVAAAAGASGAARSTDSHPGDAAQPAGSRRAETGGFSPHDCMKMATPMRDVEGKVAFITGGDSGIGLGMARAFTAAGMKVVITYRTPRHLDQAIEALKGAAGRVHAISVDVTDRPGMRDAAAEAVKVFGKVHVLVNNAGVGIFAPLTTATYDDWDWGMGVNLNGVFNGVHTFLPLIQKHGEGGQIVSTASIAGLIVDDGPGIYSTSKFAVVGMMEALRAELADANIGVSVFCPGIVNTDIGDSGRDRPASKSRSAVKPPDPKAMARMRAAMQRRGPPPGMDPLEAGELVLRGIRNNDLYILNTPELASDLRSRAEAIMASLPTGLEVPKARQRIERMILGQSVYEETIERRRCERVRKT